MLLLFVIKVVMDEDGVNTAENHVENKVSITVLTQDSDVPTVLLEGVLTQMHGMDVCTGLFGFRRFKDLIKRKKHFASPCQGNTQSAFFHIRISLLLEGVLTQMHGMDVCFSKDSSRGYYAACFTSGNTTYLLETEEINKKQFTKAVEQFIKDQY